jgi:hypothetical protein
MAPDDAVENVPTLACYTLTDIVHAGYQLRARNRGKEPGAQLAIGDRIIEDDPSEGPQVSPISSKPASSYRFETSHFYGY